MTDDEEVTAPKPVSDQGPGQGETLRDDEEGGTTRIPIPDRTVFRESGGRDPTPDLVSDDEEHVPYPALAPVVFFCVKQTTRPRSWCLMVVCNPWFEYMSMLVILLNCVTLGMFQPCEFKWSTILQVFDDFIFAFFAVEMVLKMLALGIFGSKCYLGDPWNRLDFFIVMAGMLEYSLGGHNATSAIRTVRVLRPLRAINRVPSIRILVTLVLDSLSMLGNILLLCLFVFFIFGIVGVQLWAGLLRNRCFLQDDLKTEYNLSHLSPYYRQEEGEESPFICSTASHNGMLRCHSLPPLKQDKVECRLNVSHQNLALYGLDGAGRNSCINWNQYYTQCKPGDHNPDKEAINFDNIGYALIAIFQVITLEGWVDIMYYVMDAHSFYNFIYFILLIIVGSFFMINLCLVVIATQFSETKQRENQLMQQQRARFRSNDSTLASFSEPGSCYEEMLRYIGHLYRKVKRRLLRLYSSWQSKQRKKVNPNGDAGVWGAGGGANGRSRRRWNQSIHHLINHHHLHHHHLSNGTPCGEVVDMMEMRPLGAPPELRLPALSDDPPAPPAGSESVSGAPCARGRRVDNHSMSLTLSVGEYDVSRDASRSGLPMEGVAVGADLLNCPYCVQALKNPDLEHSESDSGVSAADGIYEFTQDRCRGNEGWPGRSRSQRRRARVRDRNCLAFCWEVFRKKLERIVESKYFYNGIMIAILINALSMGIEYHQQPEELTDLLEISNIVFTSMFALEMVLKVLAFGIIGYIRNPYNIFDGIIVVISVWEIMGLSVVRTFRLLRVLTGGSFLPALRRQLVVLMKTMDNVATFCMLLMLFIFIFSILGMHLFGCKFSLETENGDTLPDRKNFDSLLWAIVTVFQIITQEDWNMVLYNGMASTSPWAALYFVALMTFGYYVLLNLLVAILVEGFQAEGDARRSDTDNERISANFEEEKMREIQAAELKMCALMMTVNGYADPRASVATPIIMRTAATPMPTPKSSLGTDSAHAFVESRRGSNTSIDPAFDQKSLSSLRSPPGGPWGAGSNWGSRRSSWNSLSRGPSLKRKDPSGERESLLSGEGQGSSEEDSSDGGMSSVGDSMVGTPLQHRARSPEPPEPLQVPMPRQDCNGRTQHHPTQPDCWKEERDYEEDQDDSFCLRIRKSLETHKPQFCRQREDWSLYLFSPQNQFRVAFQRVIAHKMFDHIVLVFIILNCITIALERPDILSTERAFLTMSNYIFTVIFVAEMIMKVVAHGFFSGTDSYLQSGWNILDGVLVFLSLVDILVSVASDGGNRILGILRVLRLLRTLRALRVIRRAPGLKLVVETLITSLRPIGNIVLICCAFFIIFGILGVQLFKGTFYHCEGPDTRNVTNRSDCELSTKNRWIRRKYNFDNLGQALVTLCVLSTLDAWVDVMYDGLDAVAVDVQPRRNHNLWMLLYFISFLLIVSFFVLNMFVGVVVENFHKCRQHQEEARLREEKRLEKRRRSKGDPTPEAQQRPYYADYSPVHLYIHTLCTNHYLDLFITFIIAINVVTMSMEHYNQPPYLEEALKYCNYGFTITFILEALLKLVAFGFTRFLKDRWNQLDLAIVGLSIMGITLEEIKNSAALPIKPPIIRIMRVLRIARVLKLLKKATGMQSLLDTVMQALPQVGNLGLLFMLLFFIYAALGVELFGKLATMKCNEEFESLGSDATFENFGMAFLTLFRVFTGDNWSAIMKDMLGDCGLPYLRFISPVYFITFVLIGQFLLFNMVVAMVEERYKKTISYYKGDQPNPQQTHQSGLSENLTGVGG